MYQKGRKSQKVNFLNHYPKINSDFRIKVIDGKICSPIKVQISKEK